MKIIDRLPFADRPHLVTVQGEAVDVYRNQIVFWISIPPIVANVPVVSSRPRTFQELRDVPPDGKVDLAEVLGDHEITVSWEKCRGEGLMQHIVVDDQQAKLISEATESVEIRDARGGHLGYVAHGFTDEDIAIAKRRLASDEPRYTTREVLDHLRSLGHK